MPKKIEYSSTWKAQDFLQVIGFNVMLAIFLCACKLTANLPTATTQPDMTMWRKTDSPLFPTIWPPTSETIWVHYTFAYGNNPTKLMDGAYVTNPLSKTEWLGGKATTTALSNDMTQVAVQGVLPLDSQTRTIFENEKQVSDYSVHSLKWF